MNWEGPCQNPLSNWCNLYLAVRSEERISKAIAEIESTASGAGFKVILKPLHGLDLSDLRTAKPAFGKFAAQEKELHILWSNAGIVWCKDGSSTSQSIEMFMRVNAAGPFLFVKPLAQLLAAAAKNSGHPSRIVWTRSVMIEMKALKGGINFDRVRGGKSGGWVDYAASKCGNLFLAHEAATRWGDQQVISTCVNTGNIYTDSFRDSHSWLFATLSKHLFLYDTKHGAYTLLFAGFSEKITLQQNGCYVWL